MNQNQYFIDKIDTLPDDLQYAIVTSDWEKTLATMQKQYKLHLDQGQVLEKTATELMFGDIDANDFIHIMFNEGHISSQVAADILLDIDTQILKKIRESLEIYAQAQEEEKEIEKIMMTDEERDEEEKSQIYADYYANMAKILADTRAQMKADGILEDGSNLTDEQVAKVMGITVEEYRRQNETGAFEEANSSTLNEIPDDISKEKEDLLTELEKPQKSFIVSTYNTKPISPDHQLENIHIETPYHQPEIVPVITVLEPVVVVQPEIEATPESQATIIPEIKKPTKISLTSDAYREPIE